MGYGCFGVREEGKTRCADDCIEGTGEDKVVRTGVELCNVVPDECDDVCDILADG